MHRSLREIMNKIEVELSDRFSQQRELESRFGFLCNAESLMITVRPSKSWSLHRVPK
jgi:uncharacterized protein YfcZ (UPF0381/DUF406 family)